MSLGAHQANRHEWPPGSAVRPFLFASLVRDAVRIPHHKREQVRERGQRAVMHLFRRQRSSNGFGSERVAVAEATTTGL